MFSSRFLDCFLSFSESKISQKFVDELFMKFLEAWTVTVEQEIIDYMLKVM